MKHLFLTVLIVSGVAANTAPTNNPRNTLITAIARSDFGTSLKALEQITDMTADEKQQYMQMADQIIFSNMMWLSSHYRQPEIGKDLIQSVGYFLGTLLSGAITAVAVGVLVEQKEANKATAKNTVLALTLAGISGILGNKAIKKLITAWQNPSIKLENSLRIKDAIFHYNVAAVLLHNNTCGTYSTAVGSSALGYNLYDTSTATAADYNTIGYYSTAVASDTLLKSNENSKAPCCCPSETNFSCRCVGHICNEEIEEIA